MTLGDMSHVRCPMVKSMHRSCRRSEFIPKSTPQVLPSLVVPALGGLLLASVRTDSIHVQTHRDLLKIIKTFYNKKVNNRNKKENINTISQTAPASTNCAGCFVLNTWYIYVPLTYRCPHDHICAPLTYMCSHNIQVPPWSYVCPWHICAPLTYMSHSLLPDFSQHIFCDFFAPQKKKHWASKNKPSSSMTVAKIILSAFKSEAWLGFVKDFFLCFNKVFGN